MSRLIFGLSDTADFFLPDGSDNFPDKKIEQEFKSINYPLIVSVVVGD